MHLQTGRVIPPLTENERMAKVYLGEGNFKVRILRIAASAAIGSQGYNTYADT